MTLPSGVVLGDCIDVMDSWPADSIDALVCDPPYGLEFMGKEWDRLSPDPDIGKSRRVGFDAANGARDRRAHNEGGTWFGSRDAATPNYTRATNAKCRNCGKWRISGGHGGTGNIYGCQCEHPDFPNVAADAGRTMQDWHHAWATAALRVAKPGAYLLAFGGTRTFHRLACAIEDAGWIIRDTLVWAYAQGFPKSRANLKPAWEPIVMARKPGPLRPLDIDAARIPANGKAKVPEGHSRGFGDMYAGDDYSRDMARTPDPDPASRWPANVILTDPIFDGGWDGVVGGGEAPGGIAVNRNGVRAGHIFSSYGAKLPGTPDAGYGDTGTYSRFFLISKAPRSERIVDGERSPHPTQKPEALIRHLVRLVNVGDGVILDPFLGSGTLGVVCDGLGIRWIGIEREPEYAAWAERRIAAGQPEWMAR